ncbi:hypothetical protein J3Q64DRAFT_1633151 [Phycomyces blakesleeanus]|uniref:Uncharacterized protein n=1 Tax=Phycomyces blakesleeanus TaxID=4837 RepID=A0ABR3BBR2_PHYBL
MILAPHSDAFRSSTLGQNLLHDIINVTGWTTSKTYGGIELEPFLNSLRPVDVALIEKGLPHLRSLSQDYLNCPIQQAFNWNTLASILGKEWQGEWFVVVFRSIRKISADHQRLFEADVRSQKEAIETGGFLKYWYADLNEHQECMAMCIWVDVEYAAKASRKPLHREAAKLAGQMYDSYVLERHRLIKRAGETIFHIEPM